VPSKRFEKIQPVCYNSTSSFINCSPVAQSVEHLPPMLHRETTHGGPAMISLKFGLGGGCYNMYYVYVLRSKKSTKRYTGCTHKEPIERLHDHNTGSNAWTRQNGPFELTYSESFSDKKSALAREKYLKTGAGRKFLDSIIPL